MGKPLLHVFLRLVKFAFSIWITASIVFLMSRLLPSANTPKGMEEAEQAMYGASDAETLEEVRSDYLERTGLNKPIFYFSMALKGQVVAQQLQPTVTDKLWVEKAVLWHGIKETENFYSIWKKVAEPQRQTLLDILRSWAISDSPADRASQEMEVSQGLRASTLPYSNQLLVSWQKLTKQPAPITSYLPVVHWQGSNNLYHDWLMRVLDGDLGSSRQDYQAVSQKIAESANVSISLGGIGLFFAIVISYLAGIQFTMHPSSMFSRVAQQFLYVLDSIPSFMIALFLLGVFLMVGGSVLISLPFEDDYFFSSIFNTPALLLGSLCVSFLIIPHLTLQFHRSLVTQTQTLYLRTALAKGLPFQKTIKKHALPNALLPSLTILSEVIIGLMAGVLVVEITFSLPGLGSLLAKSILAADYPVLVGLTLLFLIFRLVIVGLTEILYGLLDPRMKSN